MADCSKVRTTGCFKGHPCGSPGIYLYKNEWHCANHFPINEVLEELTEALERERTYRSALKEISNGHLVNAPQYAFNVLDEIPPAQASAEERP